MPYIKNGHSFVKVKCKCGKIQDLMLSDLTSSRAHSCRSCAARNRGWSNRLKIGDTVKNWTIIGGPRLKVHNIQFEVRCKCGYTRWIQPNELLNPNKCFSCKNSACIISPIVCCRFSTRHITSSKNS